MSPETCPNCGESVPSNSKACPGCGSDENTGWADDAQHATVSELGLTEEDFDYDEFTKREFGKESIKPRGLHRVWWIVGLILLGAIVFAFVL